MMTTIDKATICQYFTVNTLKIFRIRILIRFCMISLFTWWGILDIQKYLSQPLTTDIAQCYEMGFPMKLIEFLAKLGLELVSHMTYDILLMNFLQFRNLMNCSKRWYMVPDSNRGPWDPQIDALTIRPTLLIHKCHKKSISDHQFTIALYNMYDIATLNSTSRAVGRSENPEGEGGGARSRMTCLRSKL